MEKGKMLDSIKGIANQAYHTLQITGERLRLLVRSARSEKEPGDDRIAQVEEQLALANELSRIILSSTDLYELCEGFAGALRELVTIDWAAIGLIDSSADTLLLSPLSTKISSDWDLGDTIPLADTPVKWMIENEQAMVESDLSKESQFSTGESLLKQEIRAVVYMPFFSRKEIFGGLIIGSRRPNIYRERQLRLLKYTATHLAMAIENTRLFKESRDGLKREAEFIATLTHELKTPLTPIRASGALLAEELQQDLQNPQAKLAENILRSAHTLDKRLSAMLELAKVQSPTFKLQMKTIDIEPLVQEVVSQLEPDALGKEQSLNLELSPSLSTVKADEHQLKRVMFNLLSNAILLTPSGGSIGLNVKKRNSDLVIGVKDSGEGFSPEEQKYLFETYHISEADRQRPLELRLRLALCKQVVELHRGKIWVESKVGEGSTFTFSIPLD